MAALQPGVINNFNYCRTKIFFEFGRPYVCLSVLVVMCRKFRSLAQIVDWRHFGYDARVLEHAIRGRTPETLELW